MRSTFKYSRQWRQDYERKRTTAEDAVKGITSNSLVLSAGEGGASDLILNALARRKDVLVNVGVHCCNSRYPLELNDEGNAGRFIADNWFIGPVSRAAFEAGRATFTPSHFSQYAENISRSKWRDAETAILQVSPPDAHGFMSFGITTA